MGRERDAYSARFEEQVAWYDAKAGWNQLRYKRLQIATISLSALTPLLLAVNLLLVPPARSWHQYTLTLLPVAVAVLASVSAAFLTTFKYQDNWLEYRATCEALRREKVLCANEVGEYASSANPHELFIGRCERIMSQENVSWLEKTQLSSAKTSSADDSCPS